MMNQAEDMTQMVNTGPGEPANGGTFNDAGASLNDGRVATRPYAEQTETNNQQPVHALVLTGFGINCEEELAAAYRLAGGAATIVHFNEVLSGQTSIHDYDVLNFPGGFSFGDDLGSGVVMANKARFRKLPSGRTLLEEIRAFIGAGGYVVGICNGFQMLVKMGLLPDFAGLQEREVTLTHNASGRYEDRWVRLAVNPNTRSPFLKGLTSLEVPVRHGEGRLVIRDAEIRQRIVAEGLNCLTYCDATGCETDVYPLNPNGAELNCAGLTDTTGHVFGLMPHPEAFLSLYNHPDWARRKRLDAGVSEDGDGLKLFRNIVEHISQSRGPHPPAPSPKERGSLTNSASNEFVEANQVTAQDYVFTTDAKRWDNLKGYARENRHNPTPAEDHLWQELRNNKLGVKFRRQHAISQFIVDFVSIADKLVVEVDGGVHNQPEQAEYDGGRTYELEQIGYRILRFSNEQVLNDTETVLATIRQHVQPTQTATSNPN